MDESFVKLSKISEKIPTVNDLEGFNFAWNTVDGKFYGLRIIGNFKQVICLNGTNAPAIVPVGDFKGPAYLSTDPGSPISDEWWTATSVGVYTNFGGVEVTTITDVLNYIKWDNANSTWSVITVPIPGVQLQSDFEQMDTAAKDFIKNKPPRIIELKIVSDIMNPIVGNGKIIFCIPAEMNQMSLLSAHAYLSTSAPGDTKIMVRNQSNIMNADMLSTPITIDTYEPTSYTANVQAVVNPIFKQVATGDLIAIDVDQVAPASKGLGVVLIFNK